MCFFSVSTSRMYGMRLPSSMQSTLGTVKSTVRFTSLHSCHVTSSQFSLPAQTLKEFKNFDHLVAGHGLKLHLVAVGVKLPLGNAVLPCDVPEKILAKFGLIPLGFDPSPMFYLQSGEVLVCCTTSVLSLHVLGLKVSLTAS